MKFKCKTKKLFKNISLGLLGLGAIGVIGVGATKIVEHVKNDLNTIHPTFEVGGLGEDGKYVNDESTLYTKDAFKCDGLNIKLDFDNEINYEVFFYDDLGKFVSSTSLLSDGYSSEVQGTHARICIKPTNDEDGKISLKERITYPSQMTIKTSKNQEKRYFNIDGKKLFTVYDENSLEFEVGYLDSSSLTWVTSNVNNCITMNKLLDVHDRHSFKYYTNGLADGDMLLSVYEFKVKDDKLVLLNVKNDITYSNTEVISLDKETDYILVNYRNEAKDFTTLDLTKLSCNLIFIAD